MQEIFAAGRQLLLRRPIWQPLRVVDCRVICNNAFDLALELGELRRGEYEVSTS
jgi:hypothetical protein